MEDGVKEEPAKPTEVRIAGKAGWLKKSSGKFLSSYKDRYIHLDQTVIEVYENEELTTCLEKVDLDNYVTCHELKSPFKKKHRLVLIRSPKSGNKVQDVKLQAQNPEEKEAWIKALGEGINKAKNKIFDEVKVDETCSLEHVTRTRPKGNHGRRPPTRVHMKEVANVSSDGILRLDLDGDVIMPNGTHCLNTEEDKQTEPSVTMNSIQKEDIDEEATPQKKDIKPPMPPSKDNKPCEIHKEDEPKNEEAAPQKKILMPPMPPSKEMKPCVVSVDEAAVEENISDSKVEVKTDGTDTSERTPSTKSVQPPDPPSKHMKPNQPVTQATVTTEEKETQEKNEEVDVEVTKVNGASNDKEDQNKSEEGETFVVSKKVMKPQVVMWDSPSMPSKEPSAEQEGTNLKKASEVATSEEQPRQLNLTPLSTPESVKKSPGPPAPPKKKQFKAPAKKEDSSPQSGPMVLTDTTILSSEKVSEQSSKADDIKLMIPEPKTEPVGDVSSEELEEKSLDSGQHSGEESETGDQVTPSSPNLKGSSQVLDLETSEDDLEPSDGKAKSLEEPSLKTPSTTPETLVPSASPTTSYCANKSLFLSMPLKHSSKSRSASLGDLLGEDAEMVDLKGKELPIKRHGSGVKDLQSKVSFEIEATGDMLNSITTGQSGEAEMKSETRPEVLLNEAMEKLRKAEQFLREARSLKDHNKSNRLSL
ncbi:pleckstrin homology domain-containing family O member 2 [Pimephales promelas]|uniref:pleckstrin homology domain-containing family O member 2 n=1 Tax=Pimephales promelas TaxID=90988 RepID=UPI001955E278|nr:pleckstrin homology domain-containing family O member 2 [Pimephales promelas]XP_039514656.1 pleckstrin homology domain-containing family O member 2 [Pimephales promelas]KAG1959539.1 pleckstriny domain-containing family O [Pimephales promelas]KAG1959541.1 pleckstriny domain-containing family O [Pimephales promelas]